MKAIRVFAACLVLFLVQGVGHAEDIYVDGANTTGPWDGTSLHPYQRIQDGINAASIRDAVLVEDGVYAGTGNVNLDFGGKGIAVMSINGPYTCIIDCGRMTYTRGFIFQSGETSGSLVDGFTIRHGTHDLGGAIHCKNASSPTIQNCVMEENEATSGGGISCLNGSSPRILDSTIKDNRATYGGGIYCSNAAPTITGCGINNNEADRGGGVFYIAGSGGKISVNSLLSNKAFYDGGGICCDAASPEISENDLAWNSGDWHGAGIACYNDAAPLISENTIQGNKDASWGGGIYCFKSRPEILENAIYLNTAGNGGGGIYIDQCTSANLVIYGNSITNNTGGDGGGINCYQSIGLVINQNSIMANTANNNGGGIWCYKGSTPDITNNTVKGNSSAKDGGAIYCSNSAPLISGNTIESNTATQKGGGIFALKRDNNAQILGNAIEMNQADHGAGIYCYTSDPLIKGNTIQDNVAMQSAGGVQCYSSDPKIEGNILKGNSCGAYGGSTIFCAYSSPIIDNNLIVGNSDNSSGPGGTIYCTASSRPVLTSNTIADNSVNYGGSGVLLEDSCMAIFNTILWNGSSPEIYLDDWATPSYLFVASSNVKGGVAGVATQNPNSQVVWHSAPGSQNINEDPVFVDPLSGNYHLKWGSPCIGKAFMATFYVNLGPTTFVGSISYEDIEGNPRPSPAGSNPDMGAYETPLSGLPDISVKPADWSFGDVALGDHSDKTFIVQNTGSGALDVTATNLTGGSDFSIQSGGGGFSLGPGDTRNIVVRFAPASTGDQSATLSIANNVSNMSPVNVPLEGSGVSIPTPAIWVDPLIRHFGEVAMGQHSESIFTVANPGSGVLEVTATNLTGDPDFSIVSGGGAFSLNPGGVKEIVIRFTPEQALAREAILSLPNNAFNPVEIQLQGLGVTEGVPAIEISPESWDYGEVEVGLQVCRYFAVVNAGSGPLEVYETALIGDMDFQILDGAGPFSLGPGAIKEILVGFTPSSDGLKSVTLILVSNVAGGSPREILLQGQGVVPEKPDIAVGPQSWNFGEVGVGLPSLRFVTVSNPGSDTLEVQTPSFLGDSSFDIVEGATPFTLPPGGEWKIFIRFQPSSTGQKTAALVLQSNVTGKSPMEVLLEGMGVSDPEADISVNPPGWAFGEVEVGSNADKVFVLTNPGSGMLEVTDTLFEGATDFSIQDGGGAFLLEPGGVREIKVRFAPQSSGLKEASLLLANNVPGKSPLVIPMEGNGLALPEAGIEVYPSPHEYGDVMVGTHEDQVFMVFNLGMGPLEITSANLSGSSDFTIESWGGGFVVNPGGIGEILVRFAPQTEGSQSAILSLMNNTPDNNPLEVPLAGNGVMPCEGDIDGDGDVDGKDLCDLSAGFGGLYGISDLVELAEEFGRTDCVVLVP